MTFGLSGSTALNTGMTLSWAQEEKPSSLSAVYHPQCRSELNHAKEETYENMI